MSIRNHRISRQRGRAAIIVVALLAAAGLSVSTPNPASAATVPAAKTPVQQAEPLCDAPAKGEFACFGLRRGPSAASTPSAATAPGAAGTPSAAGARRAQAAAAPDGYGPADLQSAYQLPANGGAGATIAIVDAYDAPYAESDLAVYRAQYNLPACSTANGCFRKVDQRGGTDYPDPDDGWAAEAALDVDMVSASAPAARIILVVADSPTADDLGAAVDQAVALGADYVSNSYGSNGEYSDETVSDVHYDHPGVAIVASAGDTGYGVSYPAASQFVTSVGGTALTRDGSARGWSERVWNSHALNGDGSTSWGATGSGCSLYVPKPAFQNDPGCPGRTVADVSAVADPATGVAIYNSYSDAGWNVYGGTSASAPIITGAYADAGTPVQHTYPNSYPYDNKGALNDVTTGDNASCPAGYCGFPATPDCTPSYLCVAGAGYDGPTGLGTPNGVAALRAGPHGTVSGTVTDASTHAAIAGATVSFGDYHATTGADGRYSLGLPSGGYTGTAQAYGYGSLALTVTVVDDTTVTANAALTALPSQTVSGTVKDGGGHGWPLYAQISVAGVPGAPIYTNPRTGAWTVRLPVGTTYTLNVTANYPGYQPTTVTVNLGSRPRTVPITVPVDTTTASAPGYTLSYHGGGVQSFETDRSTPTGWSVKNNNANGGWQFDDVLGRTNQTGGGGGFALVDDFADGWAQVDTELISPVYDLRAEKHPQLDFKTDFPPFQRAGVPAATVDASTDDGASWTTIWQAPDTLTGPASVSTSLAGYAGKKLRLRFHYVGGLGNIWEIDDVAVGTRTFAATPGGLVVGRVIDANTGAGVAGATVSLAGASTTSVATAQDTTLGDGLYWLFTPHTGVQKLSAEQAQFGYPGSSRTMKIASGTVLDGDLSLAAGRLTVTPATVSATVAQGRSRTAVVTVRNTDTAAATFTLGERPGPVTGSGATAAGAAPHRIATALRPATMYSAATQAAATKATARPSALTEATTGWQSLPDLPLRTTGGLAATDQGKLYAGFGTDYTGTLFSNAFSVYTPATGSWKALEKPVYRRWSASGGFINGRYYVTSGRNSMGGVVAQTESYDPAGNTWTARSPNPKPLGSSSSTVLDGKLYVVGGCQIDPTTGNNVCGFHDVMVYDPKTDHWSHATDYPLAVSNSACAGIDGKLYCAGGANGNAATAASYVYDPAAGVWSRIADLPLDLWGSAYAGANGQLLVSGGVSNSLQAITDEGFAYDPASDTWNTLPNAGTVNYGGAGASGFYTVGGFDPATGSPSAKVQLLPGYDRPGADVSWLSATAARTTLAPGQSTALTVKLSAGRSTALTSYAAALTLDGSTPYPVTPVAVTMTVK